MCLVMIFSRGSYLAEGLQYLQISKADSKNASMFFIKIEIDCSFAASRPACKIFNASEDKSWD